MFRKVSLLLLIAAAMFAVCASAETIGTYEPGDIFDVTFAVTANPNKAVFVEVELQYNENALKYLEGDFNQKGVATMLKFNGIRVGDTFTARFQILPDSEAGLQNISLTVNAAYNYVDRKENLVTGLAFSESTVDISIETSRNLTYEEKDNAQVIVDVNGETVTKQVISAAVQTVIIRNQYYNEFFAEYGFNALYPTDEGTIIPQVIETYIQNLVLKQKAAALGMTELNDEEKARAEEHAKEYYDSFLQSVISAFLPNSGLEGNELTAAAEKYVSEHSDVKTVDGCATYEDFLNAAMEEVAVEKVREDIVKDVTVTEEEIKADYDAKVEADKAAMESNPDSYGYNRMNGTAVYYAPAGYRMVKHILVGISDEDTKAANEAQTALTEAQDALTNAAADADKDALQAAVDAAQAAYDAAKAAGMANAKVKADEVYAKATAEAADFDAMITEYSTDHMPEEGYAIREGYAYFVEPFVTGAMALQNVGDVSEPVESPYGYHIIKYVSDVAEGPVDIETVRENIITDLLLEKQHAIEDATIEKWVSEATVKTYPDRLN